MKKIFTFIFTVLTVLFIQAPFFGTAEAARVAALPIQVDESQVERAADFNGYYWDIIIEKFPYPEYELMDDEKVSVAVPEEGLKTFDKTTMMDVCNKTDADIVGCNFRHEFSDKQYVFQQQYADSVEENISRLINGKIFPSLCTSLTRRSLITDNKLSFPEGLNMGEDLYFNLQLFLHANKIVCIDWAPYHYRHTEDSSCVQRSRKSIDSDIKIAGLIESIMKKKGLYNQYAIDIEYRKFISKIPLIHNLNDKEQYNEWLTTYPETNLHIWQYSQIDWKQKLELWLAANKMLSVAKGFKYLLTLQHRLRRP